MRTAAPAVCAKLDDRREMRACASDESWGVIRRYEVEDLLPRSPGPAVATASRRWPGRRRPHVHHPHLRTDPAAPDPAHQRLIPSPRTYDGCQLDVAPRLAARTPNLDSVAAGQHLAGSGTAMGWFWIVDRHPTTILETPFRLRSAVT